jgi:hypothetical protein
VTSALRPRNSLAPAGRAESIRKGRPSGIRTQCAGAIRPLDQTSAVGLSRCTRPPSAPASGSIACSSILVRAAVQAVCTSSLYEQREPARENRSEKTFQRKRVGALVGHNLGRPCLHSVSRALPRVFHQLAPSRWHRRSLYLSLSPPFKRSPLKPSITRRDAPPEPEMKRTLLGQGAQRTQEEGKKERKHYRAEQKVAIFSAAGRARPQDQARDHRASA